jgi:hypothetical protein
MVAVLVSRQSITIDFDEFFWGNIYRQRAFDT